ncbi:hypothetical protein BDQ17DRAFT_1436126 [Cyathus striatus]|nr:hypothetical protein BDQ17DRAFT_1436126 [Cyathus striatus]
MPLIGRGRGRQHGVQEGNPPAQPLYPILPADLEAMHARLPPLPAPVGRGRPRHGNQERNNDLAPPNQHNIQQNPPIPVAITPHINIPPPPAVHNNNQDIQWMPPLLHPNPRQINIPNIAVAPALHPHVLALLPPFQVNRQHTPNAQHNAPAPVPPFQINPAPVPPPPLRPLHPPLQFLDENMIVIDIPDIPPPPPPPPHIPIGHQPFDHNQPKFSLGPFTDVCPDCNALHWKAECLTSSTRECLHFGSCCLTGKVKLPGWGQSPRELMELLAKDGNKNFQDNIRQNNSAFAMTSLGVQKPASIQAGGPYLFKIGGCLTHYAGSLLPREGLPKKYAQLYIHDGGEAPSAQDRINGHSANQNLNMDVNVMRTLEDVLYHHHPGASVYQKVYELIQRNENLNRNCHLAIVAPPNKDRWQYNVPAVDEIAALLLGDGDQVEGPRDVIMHHVDGGLQ